MRFFRALCVCFCLWAGIGTAALYADNAVPTVSFPEIWAYLMNGEEQYLSADYPISDLGYFGAGINSLGKLTGVPDAKKIAFFKGRKHLVIAETGNNALVHFALDPQFALRDVLIQDIAAAATPFDGVQIDFESVLAADKENFISFLYLLKGAIGSKTLSVALPARWRAVPDSFDYIRVAAIADRIIVMAYDEHWSGSVPGAIASMDWCRTVSAYALSTIGSAKLVMGMPFYGRAWSDVNPAKAYKHSSIAKLVNDKNISSLTRDGEIPSFSYQETVNVQVFYEDGFSILTRMKMYKDEAVNGVSFWRLGQEDPEVWKYLALGKS